MRHTHGTVLPYPVLVLGQGLDERHTHIHTHVACPIPVEIVVVVAKLRQQQRQQPAASRVPSIKVCVQFEYSQQAQPERGRRGDVDAAAARLLGPSRFFVSPRVKCPQINFLY